MGELARHISYDLTDQEIGEFYLKLVASGRERAAYYGNARKDVREYVGLVREQKSWWLITGMGRMLGCFYVTGVTGKSGFVHFAFLPSGASRLSGLPLPVAIGRFALAGALHDRHIDGTHLMDVLIGKTPVWNRAAIKTAIKSGGERVGIIPSCCYCHDSGGNADGVITYFTRETVPEEWARL